MHRGCCNVICHLDRTVIGWDAKLVFTEQTDSNLWFCLKSSPRLSSINSCGLGQLSDTNSKLWEWSPFKRKKKNHSINCGQQQLGTEIDSLLIVLCLLLLAYVSFGDGLVLKLFQRHQNLIIVSTSFIFLFVLLSCSSRCLGGRDVNEVNEMRIYFHAKGSSDFCDVSLIFPLAALWGIRKLTLHS